MLGMEPDSQVSPALLKKVVHAAAHSTSFREASENLRVLAEVNVSAARIRRAAQRVGQERVEETCDAAEAYRRLPLPAQRTSPGAPPPEIACIQTDGGRIQIRPRDSETTGPRESANWWRETKVGCLLEMTSETHLEDPTPTVPEVFVDPARMARMVREIKGFSGEASPDESASDASEEIVCEAPQIVAQQILATRENVDRFGERLVAAAYARGFATAGRKAFVADGSETNWSLWRRHFSDYTPILDWVHAVCYVYAAAMAGVDSREGWAAYCNWAQWLWDGQIENLLQALRERQRTLGSPSAEDGDGSPRKHVADALRYVDNQRKRMNYPQYRRQGLPITSSHVESTIKRINRRMKGSEKFWDQGAEPLLHLVADHLGPPDILTEFWKQRPTKLNSQRCYQIAT